MSDDIEHYKTQYRVLVEEQSTAADEWASVLKFARQAMQSLLIGCIGRSDGWDARIEGLRSVVNQAETADELQRVANDIGQLSREMMADPYSDPATIGKLVDKLAQVRDETTENMQNFAALAGLVDITHFAVVGTAPPVAITDDLAKVSTALLEGFRNLSFRHAEAEQFLDEVRVALTQVTSLADADADQLTEQRDANLTLQSDVNAHVAGLQSAVATSDDLSVLRRQVRAGFDAISQRMETFRDTQDNKLTVALERNQTLRSELSDLQGKTDALHEQLAEQRALLLLDSLTGVHSRFSYDQRIEEEVARASRSGEPLCYSIWDIDHFKNVNDSFGHQVGDAVLKEIAGFLVRHTRTSDFVSRIGGEEFVVLFPGTDLEAALAVADKLRLEISRASFADAGVNRALTVSCGVTKYVSGNSADDLYERADRALYLAKDDGRNKCKAA